MEMSFGQYIINPSGIKNSVFTNRQVYADLYKSKLDKILVREAGGIKYFLFEDQKTEKYYIYLKIPSEPIPNFYYDVVIEFYTNDPDIKYKKTIKDYFVKFYSNDPAFVFTFAHSMAKNKLFILDLTDKMSKASLKNIAKERNPKDEVGYVKSLYFAYLTIIRYNLFEKIQFRSYGKPYNKAELLKNIEHADIKIEKRKSFEDEINKKEKNDKIRNSVRSNNAARNQEHMSKITGSPNPNNPKPNHMTKRTSMVKRSAMTKRSKRI